MPVLAIPFFRFLDQNTLHRRSHCVIILMQWLRALYLWRWQRCKRCTNISKNTSNIINVVTTQRCRCRANILMNTSIVANVTTMQRCKRCVGISMNVFYNINALISQLGTSCSFDSPGLTSESVVYPGLFAISENNAVGVVPFIYWHIIAAFHAENVQHLRR